MGRLVAHRYQKPHSGYHSLFVYVRYHINRQVHCDNAISEGNVGLNVLASGEITRVGSRASAERFSWTPRDLPPRLQSGL